MTNHLVRLYTAAGAIVTFFLLWATIAAHPWATTHEVTPQDPRLVALAQREKRLQKRAAGVKRIVDRRWAVYERRSARREWQNSVALQRHLQQLEASQARPSAPLRPRSPRPAQARAYAASVVAWANQQLQATGSTTTTASKTTAATAAAGDGPQRRFQLGSFLGRGADGPTCSGNTQAVDTRRAGSSTELSAGRRGCTICTDGRACTRGDTRAGARPGSCATAGGGRGAPAGDDDEGVEEEVSTVARTPPTLPLTRRAFDAMGCTVELIVAGNSEGMEDALTAAEREIQRLEHMLSRFLPTSELSLLNETGILEASPEFVEVSLLAIAARERTGGRFDPTVHDAVVAAGYDRSFDDVAPTETRSHREPRAEAASPSPARRSRSSPATGSTSAASRKATPPIGPARCSRPPGPASSTRAVISRSTACPTGASGPWRWRSRGDPLTLGLRSGALATSGRDHRRWHRGGVELHHLVDPRTGRPAVTSLLRVTAFAETAADAEVAAKALLLAGGPAARTEAEALGIPACSSATTGASSRRRARMSSDPTFWIEARASGMLAFALLTAVGDRRARAQGTTLGTALKPATVTDTHRFLALLCLGATGIHGVALVLDSTVQIGIAGLLVPGFVPYRPLWVGVGVVAAELLVLVYASFSQRKRIGVKNWRRLHWATYGIFAAMVVHGVMSGTDTARPWALGMYLGAIGTVVAATFWRAFLPPAKPERRPRAAAAETA